MDMNFKESFENMPEGEPFICSFSGGKDSVIALSMAAEKGEARGLLNWFDEEQNKSVFQILTLWLRINTGFGSAETVKRTLAILLPILSE